MKSWLSRFERRLRPLAVQNITQLLILGQVSVFLTMLVDEDIGEFVALFPSKVWQGEVWRLVTFLFMPGIGNPRSLIGFISFVISMLALNFTGSAVESVWGSLRYNLFLLVGYLASIGTAVLFSIVLEADVPASNVYFYSSILLAFAWFFPNFEFALYFLFPVKVKWFALLIVAGMLFQFVRGLLTFMQGGWLDCTMIVAANLNLSLFIGRELSERLSRSGNRLLRTVSETKRKNVARHTCIVCGATDLSNPERDFRYCPQCQGTPAYCNLHLAGHRHLESVQSPAAPAKGP
jgi:hypothetical protein